MVKVEEVQDAAYASKDDRESDYATTDDDEDGFETESVSSVASDDDFNPADETLAERFAALKDIVAPSTRTRLASQWNRTAEWVKVGGKWAGNAVWVVTTSALLVGLPLALAMEDEARIVQQEKELQMQQSGQQSVSLIVVRRVGRKRGADDGGRCWVRRRSRRGSFRRDSRRRQGRDPDCKITLAAIRIDTGEREATRRTEIDKATDEMRTRRSGMGWRGALYQQMCRRKNDCNVIISSLSNDGMLKRSGAGKGGTRDYVRPFSAATLRRHDPFLQAVCLQSLATRSPR